MSLAGYAAIESELARKAWERCPPGKLICSWCLKLTSDDGSGASACCKQPAIRGQKG